MIQVLLALAAAAWAYIDPAHSIPVMVALLVMSCPCAMSMAVPTAMASAHAALAAHPSMPDAALQALLDEAGQGAPELHGSLVWHLLMTPLALVGWVTPWLAAITMLLSSLAVAWNSWRLSRRDLVRRIGRRRAGIRMTILYLLLPLSLLFVLAIGVSLWWAVFSGQYDDTDSAGTAILRDDDSGPGSRG